MKTRALAVLLGVLLTALLSGCRGELVTIVDVDNPGVAGFEIRLSGLIVEALDADPGRLEAITGAIEDELNVTPAVTRDDAGVLIGIRELPLAEITQRSGVTGVSTLVITQNTVLLEMVQPEVLVKSITGAAGDASLSETIAKTTFVTVTLISQDKLLLEEGDASYVIVSGSQTSVSRALSNTGSMAWKFAVEAPDTGGGLPLLLLVITSMGVLLLGGGYLLWKRKAQPSRWDAPSA